METIIEFDLDMLCIAAEVAAVLLLLSLTWRPASRPEPVTSDTTDWDWGPYECVFVQAAVATGRAIGNRVEEQDCNRLSQLQQQVPVPWRDRLTGLLNASGMDRLICQWSADRTSAAPTSCYVLLTLRSHDDLMDQHGAMVAEMAIRSIGETLQTSFTDRAVVSRYQPNRFLVHRFASNVAECKQAMEAIIKQIAAPEYFSPRGNAIVLECEAQYWESVRSVDPEQLLRLLEDGDPAQSSSTATECNPIHDHVAEAEPAEATETALSESTEIDSIEPAPESDHEAQDPSSAQDPPNDLVSAESETFNEVAEAIELQSTSKPCVSADADAGTDESGPGRALQGYASAEDIASLFAELQGADPSTTKESETAVGESEEPARVVLPTRHDAMQPEWDTNAIVPSRSIYTDDIEAAGIDDDLASLFATVRSSARGSFAHHPESIVRQKPVDLKSPSGPTDD